MFVELVSFAAFCLLDSDFVPPCLSCDPLALLRAFGFLLLFLLVVRALSASLHIHKSVALFFFTRGGGRSLSLLGHCRALGQGKKPAQTFCSNPKPGFQAKARTVAQPQARV